MATAAGEQRSGATLPESLTAELRAIRSPERAMELLLNTDRTQQDSDQQASARPDGLDDLVGAAVELLEPGAVTAGLLESVAPSAAVSGRARLQMIAGLDRQIARLQAQQAAWIASFARPGVAASYPELLDLAVLGKGTRMDTDELLELLPDRLQNDTEACDRILSRHPDWQAELDELAAKAAAHEIGAVLGIAPISARNRIQQARTLVHDYSRTFEAMLAGQIDRIKANVLIEELDVVSPELRVELEESALSQASSFTAGRWAKRLRKWAIETDPESAERRAENATRSRKVRITPTDTDSARFAADVPADQALLAWAVLNHTAEQLPDDIRAGRTLDQLRADVFAGIFADLAARGYVDLRHPDVLPESLRLRPPAAGQQAAEDAATSGADNSSWNNAADSPGADPNTTSSNGGTPCDPGAGDSGGSFDSSTDDSTYGADDPGREPAEPWSPCIAATVTIAASTLTGLDNDPATLAGYGWITAGLGRALAASASSLRLAVQHDSGASPPDPPPPTDSGSPPDGAPPDSATRDSVSAEPAPADTTSTEAMPPGTTPPETTQPDTTPPDTVPTPSCAHRPGHGRCSADAESRGPVDRACGTDLDHGRAVYRPPIAVADRVRQRDQVCRFFGCTQPTERCDLDHRTPYDAGGPTCPCNLDGLCRPHHMGKTFLQWRAIRLPANHLRWTTPHGYVVDDHPEPQPLGTRFTIADLQAASPPPQGERPPTPAPPSDDPPPF